jgi:hypothetical protein
VIDYRVSYDQSTGSFVELASGVLDKSYTTSVTLTPGAYYILRVQARNSVGYSEASVDLQVQAA